MPEKPSSSKDCRNKVSPSDVVNVVQYVRDS